MKLWQLPAALVLVALLSAAGFFLVDVAAMLKPEPKPSDVVCDSPPDKIAWLTCKEMGR